MLDFFKYVFWPVVFMALAIFCLFTFLKKNGFEERLKSCQAQISALQEAEAKKKKPVCKRRKCPARPKPKPCLLNAKQPKCDANKGWLKELRAYQCVPYTKEELRIKKWVNKKDGHGK